MAAPIALVSSNRPRPLTSLLASAQRLTSAKLKTSSRSSTGKNWQEDAWEMYDLVGEERFLANTLAGRMSQARLYVGRLAENVEDEPDPVDDPRLQDVLDAVGDTPAGRAQMILRMGINLFVAGDCWLVGIPKYLVPVADPNDAEAALPQVKPQPDDLLESDLEWHALSVSELSTSGTGELTIRLGEGAADQIKCAPEDVWLIRVWRPHPRRWWEADSPTRSSLPVLRELVGLTMHISAQVDSRLAGAGLLIVPQSAQRSLRQAAGLPDTPEDGDPDPFTEALIEAMLTPIGDRSNASALVPLVVTVPDEVTGMFNFMSFAKPLDTEARPLRDEAIRRLALGQDAPPELLLGTAGMNHWGAWLVQEDVITTHIEPPLALVCDALTTGYLWPALEALDYPDPQQYVVWYDVSDMIVRPNRAQDAGSLYDKGALSDTALRAANGFDESDAPITDDMDEATSLAFELVRKSPGLLTEPGLANLVTQIRKVLAGDLSDAAAPLPTTEEGEPPPEATGTPTEEEPPSNGELPGTAEEPAPAIAASAFGGPGSGRYPKGSGGQGVGTRDNVDRAFLATDEQLNRARDVARAKFKKLPVPTDADRADAEARHARNKRQGGDDRGSSAQRRRNREVMLEQFGDGEKCPCVNCGVMLSMDTVSLDRIIPGSDGGRYRQANLIPMDYDCNRERSNSSFEEMMNEWP
jgi:hypothetical protein